MPTPVDETMTVRGHRPDGFRLSLVLPAWNEEETIARAVGEATAALSAITQDYEIIVVNDGSSDGTADIVRAAAAADPRVRLVEHPRNLGYGAALRTGFQAATMDLVAFTDADCQFDLGELAYVLPLTRHYDVTCGYRIDRQDPAHRRFFSWGYNTLVKLLMGSPVHDLDCALKVFRREQLPAILPECNNFFVNTEMLTRARQLGLSVVEVGVHHRPRAAGESKVSLWDIPRTLSVLLPFWWTRVLFPGRDREAGKFGALSWLGLLLLTLVAGAILLLHLSYPLIKPDEGRYAVVAREMLASGDWVVPTFNHEPYYDKPPLFYWLTAGSFALFGKTEKAARLVPALAALLTILATYLFAHRIVGPRAGFLAGLVLTLTCGFVQCGRFIVLDGPFTLFVTLGLFTAYEAVRGQRLHWKWWLTSAVFCALAVLIKGPVAFVLLVPPVVAQGWLNRDRVRVGLGAWAGFLALAVAVAAPWFVMILARDPGFARHFFIDHHLGRFFTGGYHDSPVWFYVPVLLIGGLPWSLLLIPLVRFLFSRSPQAGGLRAPALGYFVLWAGWCVLFFSLSRGKLPPYVLPAVPALAVITGCYLDFILSRAPLAALFREARTRVPQRALLLIAASWLVLGGIGWWKNLVPLTEYMVEAVVCVAVLAGVLIWGRRLPPKVAWALCAVAMGAALYELCDELVPAWSNQRSPIAHLSEVAELLRDGDTAVASYGHDWCSLPLEVDREDVTNITFYPPRELKKFLDSHARTVLITKSSKDLQILRRSFPPSREISKVVDVGDTRVVVIEAAPPPAPPPSEAGPP
ncbi:MAG TPA: glycosyltransferase [Gemmataceae bacterium]|nr:glycosyltransferase [Gemmataceae bacterium]